MMVLALLMTQIVTTPYLQRWEVRCPSKAQGYDGKPLCRAILAVVEPTIAVERTDSGMTLTLYHRCQANANPDQALFSDPQIKVPLPAELTSTERRAIFNRSTQQLEASVNAFCGYQKAPRTFDQTEVERMLKIVFETMSTSN